MSGYGDNWFSRLVTAVGDYVAKAGDTMTGTLMMNASQGAEQGDRDTPDIVGASGRDLIIRSAEVPTGGDSREIGIYAGDGATDTGEEVTGATGGGITIRAGFGGDAPNGTSGPGGEVVLRGGTGGSAGGAAAGGNARIQGGYGVNGGAAGAVILGSVNIAGTVQTNSGIQHTETMSLPEATSALRGTVLFIQGGAEVLDTMWVCVKNTSDGYEWREVTLAAP